MSAPKLVRPSEEYKKSFLEALKEYHAEGNYTYLELSKLKDNFSKFVKELQAERGHPHQPYQDWVEPVPETVLWLVKDKEYIGTVDIRHRLNWHLEKWGGHMHIIIRPGKRRKGYGRRALNMALPFANHLGIDKVLLTVAPDNEKAIKAIEEANGELQDETKETDQFPKRIRYWVSTI